MSGMVLGGNGCFCGIELWVSKLLFYWANALKEGSSVKVSIEPNYSGSSIRPDSFGVTFSIDGGRPIQRNIKNTPGGE